MDAVSIIALSMGAAWASGINLYATIFMLGYMGMTGNIVLPEELQVLSNPMVMTAAGFMYCVEFFADKIPGVDSGWDSLHTFIRIPAGAMLAASAVGDVTPAVELTAAILGGALAAGSHTTKAGSRLLINTSPEPVSNWGASITEDLLVIGGLWAALNHPVLFLMALVLFIILMIWLLPRLWRLFKVIFRRIGSWLGLCEPPPPAEPKPSTDEQTRITKDSS
ncbi:DUF4126 domain-containing protein [Methylophaga sp. OBS4]|uniref:DUF4126 domain-containing protein n=1 Tax=Methylophaga sp. OBS4 TaxID=2991935 RepID=UPI0022534081|nr:DUF4126 domain-containing protein [Methylophaga sp. OBS4]MCX4187652.1 DUF4126 domain-containing protein [Methylophaga sp. OBS4]